MRRHRLAAGALAVGTLVLTACGTRLDDADFVQAQQAQQGVVPVPGATASAGAGGGDDAAGPGHGTAGGDTGSGGLGSSDGGSGAGGIGATGPSDSGEPNTASDVGVTPTTITIGSIVSKTNPFDQRAFVGPSYGIEAFVHWINAHGGIHGRQVILKTCDDQGSGNANVSCVHQLIDSDHVFALVSNAVLTYAGADYVNSKGVIDMGAQPIDNVYAKYPHLYDIYGEYYPRDGKQIGFDGKLYGGTEVYKYFSERFPDVRKVAGVVEYNQAASQRFGDSIVNGLQHEGYDVVKKVVNFALPDYDSVAIDFRNKGVQFIYDVIDRSGNVRLCKALDDNNVDFTAKILTPQSWEQSVGDEYRDASNCRDKLWATGMTLNYADTKYPQVKAFRDQMSADGHSGSDQMSEWALEGWAGGVWFADAAASCGADLTRDCLEAFVNSGKPYDAHGLLVSRWFEERKTPDPQVTNCINVAQWSDSAGTWVTRVPDMQKNCYTLRELPYSAG